MIYVSLIVLLWKISERAKSAASANSYIKDVRRVSWREIHSKTIGKNRHNKSTWEKSQIQQMMQASLNMLSIADTLSNVRRVLCSVRERAMGSSTGTVQEFHCCVSRILVLWLYRLLTPEKWVHLSENGWECEDDYILASSEAVVVGVGWWW